jgi:hypothetical protein
MFVNPPQIYAHVSVLDQGNFVLPDIILSESNQDINLLHRHCPHRRFPLHTTGDHVTNIVCKFHNFEWDRNGTPVNNTKKLRCGQATVGRSGLVFRHFSEPDHRWVDDLAAETQLVYSHCCQGSSKGSWLWMMEIQADLLHVYPGEGAIHPRLSSVENLDDVVMESGHDWILQTCSTGWWLFIYPFTFIEWSKGCLSVNYTIPDDTSNEFGFSWITQFYYAPTTTQEKRKEFETLEDVFREDVSAIEMQKGNYFPLGKAMNAHENHCVHWGKWVQANKTT